MRLTDTCSGLRHKSHYLRIEWNRETVKNRTVLIHAEVFFMERNQKKQKERMKRNSEAASSSPLLRMLRGSILGILSAIAVSLVSALFLTWILLRQENPDQLLFPLALVLLAVGSLCVGIVAIRHADTDILPTALLASAMWTVISALISLFVPSGIGSLPAIYAIALRIPQAAFVIFGVLIGKSRPRRISPRRRH
jgi:hypothetical protein